MTARHEVWVGPDWWGCICWQADGALPGRSEAFRFAADHAGCHGVEVIETTWPWSEVKEIGPTAEDAIEWLRDQQEVA